MRILSKPLLVTALALSLLSGLQASAQGGNFGGNASGRGFDSEQSNDTRPHAVLARLKAVSGDTELKCSGPAGKATCISDYAFVCPSGWNACKAPSEGGTCCTQR